jgi:membrane associated rhomboid family serine protease
LEFSITLVLVIVTVLVSIGGLSQPKIMEDLIFYPPAIKRGQYYRFISHGFIHADFFHLAFNMIALFSFGVSVEKIFSIDCLFGEKGKYILLVLYFSALIVASLPDYIRFKDSYHFRSLGASGAVSAMIFSSIIFFPQADISFFFIPHIPGYIFAILYLGISAYLDKRGGSNVNHGAHFWGAAYGIVFTLVCCRIFASDFNVYDNFMYQIKSNTEQLILQCGY